MEELQHSSEQMAKQDGLYHDACLIIDQAQVSAYRSVNETLIKRNWLLGMRIQYEVLNDKRAEYGESVIKELANALTMQYGKGFTWRNLYNYMDFYQKHEDFFCFVDSMHIVYCLASFGLHRTHVARHLFDKIPKRA